MAEGIRPADINPANPNPNVGFGADTEADLRARFSGGLITDTLTTPEPDRPRWHKRVVSIIGNGISEAWNGITGHTPTADQIRQASARVLPRLEGVRVFGNRALDLAGAGAHAVWDRKTEMVASALMGAAAKTTVRAALGGTLGITGGFAAAAVLGAAGGAASAAAKEYLRQRGSMPETVGVSGIRARLKEEVKNLGRADGRRLAIAAGKGAAWGVVGGEIGAGLAEIPWVQEQLAKVGGLIGFGGQSTPDIGSQPAATAVPAQVSVPQPEATPTPLSAEKPTFAPSTPAESPVPTAPAQPGVPAEAPKPPVVPATPARTTIGHDFPKRLHDFVPEHSPAAAVGANLDLTDKIAEEALRSQGLDPSHVSSATRESARLAVQRAMEAEGNTIFINTEQEFINQGEGRWLSMGDAREEFEKTIATEEFHNKAVGKASVGVTQHLEDLNKLSEDIQGVLAPEAQVTVDLKSGDTVSDLLVNIPKNDFSSLWDNKAAKLWGSVIALNYNLFENRLLEVAGIDLSELPDLVQKAENGDQEALMKLRKVVRLIPNHGKFVMPANMEAVGKVI